MRIQVLLTLVTGILENLFLSGFIYGWPSFEYVLLKERYFQHLCTNQTLLLNSCTKQASMLNLAFYLAIVSSFLCLPPIGWAMDKYGTWKMRSVATASLTAGVVCMLVSSPSIPWLIFPGTILIGNGGMGFLVSNPQTSNFFPKVRSILIILFDSLYMASACIFLFLKLAYDSGIQSRVFFAFLLAVTTLPWIRTYTLMPRKSFPYPIKDPDLKYGIFEWSQGGSINELTTPLVTSQTKNDVSSANLKNPLVWSIMIQVGVLSLRFAFFEASLVSWLTTFLDSQERISYLVNMYGILLLFSFVFAIPSGLVVDCLTNYLKGENSLFYGLLANMLISSGLVILFSIAVVVRWPITALWCSALGQVSVFGGATNFYASAFPMDDFGKLFGWAGIVGTLFLLLEVAFYQLSLIYDPTFSIVNYVLLGFCVLTLFHPIAWFKLGQENLKKLNLPKCSN